MKTRRLSLSVVLQLKKTIEKTLNEALSNHKKKANPELLAYAILLSNQLLHIKMAIDRGNSKKHSFFGKSNTYWIFELSNTKGLLESCKNKKDIDHYTKQVEKINNSLSKFNITTTVKLPMYPEFIQEFKV